MCAEAEEGGTPVGGTCRWREARRPGALNLVHARDIGEGATKPVRRSCGEQGSGVPSEVRAVPLLAVPFTRSRGVDGLCAEVAVTRTRSRGVDGRRTVPRTREREGPPWKTRAT